MRWLSWPSWIGRPSGSRDSASRTGSSPGRSTLAVAARTPTAARDIPDLDAVSGLAARALPAARPDRIMHGDYSMFNVMFAHGAPAHLAAILDWDTSTIGEP